MNHNLGIHVRQTIEKKRVFIYTLSASLCFTNLKVLFETYVRE